MKRRRWLLIASAGVLLLAAGVSAALFMSHRRDVTTTSEAACEAYQDGVANENRFYFKEARLAYARALELDPSFAMAMLGLARQSKDPAQGAALLKRAAREKGRLTERERLHVDMALAMTEKRHEDALKIAERDPREVPDRHALGLHSRRQRARQGQLGPRDQDLRGAALGRPEQRRGLQPDRLLLRLPRRLREGHGEPQAVPVHRRRQRQPLRLAGRGAGVLGPLQRGDREPEPGAGDQAGLRGIRRSPRRGVRGSGRVRQGDRDVREGGGHDGVRRHAPRLPDPRRCGRPSTTATRGKPFALRRRRRP